MTGPEETHDEEGQMAPREVDEQTVHVPRSSRQGNSRQENKSPRVLLSNCSVLADAFAQMFVCGVIRESSEFVLDGFRQVGVLDDGVLRHLVREL